MDQIGRMPRHVIAKITYALERIDCSCGAVITAEPDRIAHDRHLPLVQAWEAHRRAAGLRKGTGKTWATGRRARSVAAA